MANSLRARPPLCCQVSMRFDHVARFVELVERAVQARNRLAVDAVGPQLLAQAPLVVGDQGVGRLQDRCWWNGSSAPGGWSPRRGNRRGSAGCSRPARRASRRSTGRRRRRSSGCRRPWPAAGSRRTGWRWYPGIRPPGYGGSAAGSARARRDGRARGPGRAAAARRSPPARRGRRPPRRPRRCSAWWRGTGRRRAGCGAGAGPRPSAR